MTDPPQEIVGLYLRGQNLEHVRRTDEAIAHYERAVTADFDSAGPYDRLIAIYLARESFADVVRVAEAALAAVRTHDDKRTWYRRVRDDAEEAAKRQPDATGAEF